MAHAAAASVRASIALLLSYAHASDTFVCCCCCQAFFKDLGDDKTTLGEWFKGVKKNMQRMIVARKTADGDSFDKGASELYLQHVMDMIAALQSDKCDATDADAAERALVPARGSNAG